jgi:hypothetical protein
VAFVWTPGGWCWLGDEPKYARFVLLYFGCVLCPAVPARCGSLMSHPSPHAPHTPRHARSWVIIGIIIVIYLRVWIFIRQQDAHITKKKGLLHSAGNAP